MTPDEITAGERELLETYERLQAILEPSTARSCRRSPSATRSRRSRRCGRWRTGSEQEPGQLYDVGA